MPRSKLHGQSWAPGRLVEMFASARRTCRVVSDPEDIEAFQGTCESGIREKLHAAPADASTGTASHSRGSGHCYQSFRTSSTCASGCLPAKSPGYMWANLRSLLHIFEQRDTREHALAPEHASVRTWRACFADWRGSSNSDESSPARGRRGVRGRCEGDVRDLSVR